MAKVIFHSVLGVLIGLNSGLAHAADSQSSAISRAGRRGPISRRDLLRYSSAAALGLAVGSRRVASAQETASLDLARVTARLQNHKGGGSAFRVRHALPGEAPKDFLVTCAHIGLARELVAKDASKSEWHHRPFETRRHATLNIFLQNSRGPSEYRSVPVECVGYSPAGGEGLDIAIYKNDHDDLEPLPVVDLDLTPLQFGTPVVSPGFPKMEFMIARGEVIRVTPSEIRTTQEIIPGYSGAPMLVERDGTFRVAGMLQRNPQWAAAVSAQAILQVIERVRTEKPANGRLDHLAPAIHFHSTTSDLRNAMLADIRPEGLPKELAVVAGINTVLFNEKSREQMTNGDVIVQQRLAADQSPELLSKDELEWALRAATPGKDLIFGVYRPGGDSGVQRAVLSELPGMAAAHEKLLNHVGLHTVGPVENGLHVKTAANVLAELGLQPDDVITGVTRAYPSGHPKSGQQVRISIGDAEALVEQFYFNIHDPHFKSASEEDDPLGPTRYTVLNSIEVDRHEDGRIKSRSLDVSDDHYGGLFSALSDSWQMQGAH